MVTRAPRREGSRVLSLLVGFVVLVITTALYVAVFAAPVTPSDLVVITALLVTVTVIGWALTMLWQRITRKRRQYRNSG